MHYFDQSITMSDNVIGCNCIYRATRWNQADSLYSNYVLPDMTNNSINDL